ncbi:MAG: LytTR family DNA-binding domain-containing protein [Paludibacteraceae bacterium]|nr:LytTR family DNA-binding domain-containing protein [Paludibacteraceae bacterium]
MNTYLIIEDEMAAFKLLKTNIKKLEPSCIIEGPLQTIEESVEYLKNNPTPDVIFMDVTLADGSSFAIFDEVDVVAPIVFTTAYEEYAISAFNVNAVDYLLKPIDIEKLKHAMHKHAVWSRNQIDAMRQYKSKKYKNCILIQKLDRLIPIETKEIAMIYLNTQIVQIVTFDGSTHILNSTLEEIYNQLNPHIFYRADRQHIINRYAIKEITNELNNKLSVRLNIRTDESIFISKIKATEFKQWLTETE